MNLTPEQNERLREHLESTSMGLLRFMSSDARAENWRQWAIAGWLCLGIEAITIIVLLALWP